MKRFKVKVCGITRPKDAQMVCLFGADMLGMIFHEKSLRYITVDKALKIIKKIPPTIARVGVFVNEISEKTLTTACKLQLDYIQLSGNEPDRQISKLQKNGFKVIKSFHITNKNDYKKLSDSEADIILLDNTAKDLPGGTGSRFNWSLKPTRRISNLMLAGGINVDNVEEGLLTFSPIIIDVNSGVESRPGIKSEKKLKQFFKKCTELQHV